MVWVQVNTTWVERACAKMLTQKFAARLFDGALPDPEVICKSSADDLSRSGL